ncbi:MAG: metalloregulator ArsR/SmtB family transcription factor [Pseudomonadota bacterium]|nr:metalloregulator ArsR/SmtB family transcription factor [Pseudomonadota bacterium]
MPLWSVCHLRVDENARPCNYALDMPPLAPLFAALADPTRLAIVERLLAEGERTVGELAAPFALSTPVVSRHLKALREAGLIETEVRRQWRVCRVRPEALAVIDDWLGRHRAFWSGSLDRLERLIDKAGDLDG